MYLQAKAVKFFHCKLVLESWLRVFFSLCDRYQDNNHLPHVEIAEGMHNHEATGWNEYRPEYEAILDSAERQKGHLYFVYGHGGMGKTYFWRALISRLKADRKIVLPVPTSGITDLLLPGGCRAHSTFGLPLDPHETSTCQIG